MLPALFSMIVFVYLLHLEEHYFDRTIQVDLLDMLEPVRKALARVLFECHGGCRGGRQLPGRRRPGYFIQKDL